LSRTAHFSDAKWGLDFLHCLQWDFKFYGIVDGTDTDKEKESITVDQIAGKDDITTILNL
jgi:hypothetical protein